jgi:predicted RecB family nuclease
MLIEAVPTVEKELRRIRDRIVDLLPIVRDHVYHPDFGGTFSLKSVHPALTGKDLYGSMALGHGRAAMDALERLMFDPLSRRERQRLRGALLRYCRADTRALIDLRRQLVTLSLTHESGSS